MHRSDEAMICIGNFKKKSYIFVISVAKSKIFVVFALYVSEILPCFMAISAWIYIALTAMKR
jgi:hypothetical protein